MRSFSRIALAIAVLLADITVGCGGGTNSQGSPPPPPPPPLASPAFVYVANTSTNSLTGIEVTGGTPANLSTSLPALRGTSPAGLAARGKLLYVADAGSGNVEGFSFDASTGALQSLPGSPYVAAAGVRSLALCPPIGGTTAPRFLYAAATSGPLLGYSIGNDGSLTVLPGSPFGAGSQPSAVVVDSACKFAFVANAGSNNISVFSVDSATGMLTAVIGSPFAAGTAPVALVTGDNFLFAANSHSNDVSVFTINNGTGSGGFLTAVVGSPVSAGTSPSALVYFSPTLYVANSGSNNVSAFSVALQTGTTTPVTGSPFTVGTQPRAMITLSPPAHDVPQQFFLYVANAGSNDISGFTIDGSGMLTTAQGFPFPAGTDPEALVFACGNCGFP